MAPITWNEFEEAAPSMAAIGRRMIFEFDVGLGFLATVGRDGAPRVHPIAPTLHDGRLFALIVPGPKLADLRRDGRFAFHSETFPPPREDDGFYITGRVAELHDEALIATIGAQYLAERSVTEKWPGFDDQVFFELLVDRALLTLTQPLEGFDNGATVWRPGSAD